MEEENFNHIKSKYEYLNAPCLIEDFKKKLFNIIKYIFKR